MGCSTLGVAERIRVPWAAARMMTAAGACLLTRPLYCPDRTALRRASPSSGAPPPGFEPGPHGTKGRRAAVTPGRKEWHRPGSSVLTGLLPERQNPTVVSLSARCSAQVTHVTSGGAV